MFNDNMKSAAVNDSGSMVKSGYNAIVTHGRNKLRNQFKQALEFRPVDATVETINRYTNIASEMKSQTMLMKRASKVKLDAAAQALAQDAVIRQHTIGAAGLELQWQNGNNQFQQQITEKILDLGIQHQIDDGFTKTINIAAELVKDI